MGLRSLRRTVPYAGIIDFGKKLVNKIRGKKPEDPYKDRLDLQTSLQKLQDVSGEFSILVRGLEATGMLPELAKIVEDGQKRRKKEPEQPPMTLFAPTDSAFAQLPEDCLFADCLKELDVPAEQRKPALIQELKISLQGLLSTGRWSVSELSGKSIALAAENGRKIALDLRTGSTVSDYEDYVVDMDLRAKIKVRNCVGLVAPDLQCSNGVIHIVDSVIDGGKPLVLSRPPNSQELAALTATQLQAKGQELEDQLREKRERLAKLEGEVAPLWDLVNDRKLSKPSVKELQTTFERLSADYDNLKRRNEEQMAETAEISTRAVLKQMLSVLDTFEMAEGSLAAETEGERKIVAAYAEVSTSLLDILNEQGVTAVEALGVEFDPMLHEAVSRQESMEYEEGANCMQYQRGYQVGSMLVRPALVVVSMGPGPSAAPAQEPTAPTGEAATTDAAIEVQPAAVDASAADAEPVKAEPEPVKAAPEIVRTEAEVVKAAAEAVLPEPEVGEKPEEAEPTPAETIATPDPEVTAAARTGASDAEVKQGDAGGATPAKGDVAVSTTPEAERGADAQAEAAAKEGKAEEQGASTAEPAAQAATPGAADGAVLTPKPDRLAKAKAAKEEAEKAEAEKAAKQAADDAAAEAQDVVGPDGLKPKPKPKEPSP